MAGVEDEFEVEVFENQVGVSITVKNQSANPAESGFQLSGQLVFLPIMFNSEYALRAA